MYSFNCYFIEMKNSLLTYAMCSREFDENLIRRVSEHFHEDEVLNLPSPPDVCNYLMSEVSKYETYKLCIKISIFRFLHII